jgi:predicted Zn-dependent protease
MIRFPMIAFVVLAVFAGCSSDPQTELQSIKEDAEQAIAELNFDEARELAQEAGEVDPSHPLPAYIEGRIMEAQLQWLDALYNYTLVISAQPDDAEAYAGLYRVYSRIPDPEMAAKAAQSYSSLRPDDPEARFVLAQSMVELKQFARARQQVSQAVELGLAETPAQLLRALSFVGQGRLDSANAILSGLGVEALANSRDLLLAAEVLAGLGSIDSAMALSQTAAENSGGDIRASVDHFYRALKHNYRWAARQVIYGLGDGEKTQGLRDMMWMLYFSDGERQSYSRAARIAVGQSMGQTVSVLFWGILAYPPKAHMMAAMDDMMLIRGEVRSQQWPEHLQAYVDYLLATKLAWHMEEKMTLQALEAVRAPMVNRAEVKTKQALFRKRVGLDQEAQQSLDVMTEYHRNQPEWLTAIGDVYTNHAYRAWDRAAQLYQDALEADSMYRRAFVHWVRMYIDNQEYGQALDVFSRYPYFAHHYPGLACLKAEMMVRTGNADKGVALFQERIPECPQVIGLWDRIVEPLIVGNHLDLLADLAELAESLAGGNPDLLVIAADLASHREDYGHALELADRAVGAEEISHDATAEKARALYFLDRKDEAFELFGATRKSHRLNSRNDYWYSRLLARDQRELQLAANVAREAMFNRPENVWVWSNLSYVYYRSARWQLAFGEARNCAQKHSDHPLPYFRRGLAEWKMAKPEAEETLRKSLRLGLWGDYREEAQRVLQQL